MFETLKTTDFLFGKEKEKASLLEIQRSLIVSNTWKTSKYTNRAAMKKKSLSRRT
jgi:hypothetical protein